MGTAKWTFMVYMAANNDLSDFASSNLDDMRKVGSNDDVKVVVFVKQQGAPGTPTNARRIQIGKKGQPDVLENLGSVDSGHPQTVIDFIRWGVQTAPAARYAVILWSHGSGWSPDDMDQLYKKVQFNAAALTRGEAKVLANSSLGRVFFSTTLATVLAAPTSHARAVLADDETGHSLDTLELGSVLSSATSAMGHRIDLLGMDACLMNDLEVAYQVANDVGVIVGSEELEPGAGWSYDSILSFLVNDADAHATDLAKTIVSSYISRHGGSPELWPVTQSALKSDELGNFADTLDALVAALRPQLQTGWPMIQRAHLGGARFKMNLVDLLTFCTKLEESAVDGGVKAAARKVARALKPGGLIITEGHFGKTVAGCGGVSIYFPPAGLGISKYYGDLQFAKERSWSQFLSEYQAAAGG
ncbi:clostripain-related cysteine peptidase [Rhodopseudomonas sp. RCAM05734]|uniref:clostripain-related cysteine peptidase n=1 Tax=Rhodopseudomonas sp. RCAM05734 TaxID=3457549 RepID=UPI0040447400